VKQRPHTQSYWTDQNKTFLKRAIFLNKLLAGKDVYADSQITDIEWKPLNVITNNLMAITTNFHKLLYINRTLPHKVTDNINYDHINRLLQ